MEKSLNSAFECAPLSGYEKILRIVGPLYRFLFRIKTEGLENLPEQDGFYVVANHLSNHDPFFVAVALGRRMHFMAKKELFGTPVVGRFVKAMSAFPIDRGNADLASIRTAIGCIKRGESVAIFPQGHRCIGAPASSMPPKAGLGMLVGRTASTVVPVAIVTKNNRAKLFRPVTVKIGKPIPFGTYGVEGRSSEDYQTITDTVFDRVCGMIES